MSACISPSSTRWSPTTWPGGRRSGRSTSPWRCASGAEGKLLLAGAFDPPDGALLVFRADSAAEVEAFVAADPYVTNGLVTRHTVRPWTVVVGGEG